MRLFVGFVMQGQMCQPTFMDLLIYRVFTIVHSDGSMMHHKCPYTLISLLTIFSSQYQRCEPQGTQDPPTPASEANPQRRLRPSQQGHSPDAQIGGAIHRLGVSVDFK